MNYESDDIKRFATNWFVSNDVKDSEPSTHVTFCHRSKMAIIYETVFSVEISTFLFVRFAMGASAKSASHCLTWNVFLLLIQAQYISERNYSPY